MSKFPLKILSALITKIENDGNVGIGIWLLFEETQNVGEICVKGTEINNYRSCGQEGSKIGFNYLHIPPSHITSSSCIVKIEHHKAVHLKSKK